MNNGGVHSLTIYHRDNKNLIATHYCPQGNQPRLKMAQSGSGEIISFGFQDATNLPSLGHSHQSALSFEIAKSGSSLIRREAYTSAAGTEQSSLDLVRLP